MNKYIVITSIFSPTEAVKAFSAMKDYQLIVVGDKKSPANWNYEHVDFMSVAEQDATNFELARVLPYNHYSRKMMGYLKAINQGANYIIDTDDDNIPKTDWAFPEFEQEYETIAGDQGFVNIYQLYTPQKIWPRGLPLNLINQDFALDKKLTKKLSRIGIWQGLADEDPDVDALYRLTSDAPCYFEDRPPVVLDRGTVTPFNTQNTIIRQELFSLMYLPTYVTFRFTDILRGLVAQPIMWLYGYQLGFTQATVVQKRNPHDYMKDFLSEVPMYEHGEKVVDLVTSAISASESIETNLFLAYKSLLKEQIVSSKEMITLDAWLKDVSR